MIPIEDSEDETDAAECEEVSPAEEMGVNDMEKQENTGVEEYFSPVSYTHLKWGAVGFDCRGIQATVLVYEKPKHGADKGTNFR